MTTTDIMTTPATTSQTGFAQPEPMRNIENRIIENINATVSARYTLANPVYVPGSASSLCPACKNIFDVNVAVPSPGSPISNALRQGEIPHQSLDQVAEAAKRGCHLCVTVYMNIDPAALRAFRRYANFTQGRTSPDVSSVVMSWGFVSIVPIARDQARLSFRWIPSPDSQQDGEISKATSTRSTYFSASRNESRNTNLSDASYTGRMDPEINVELIIMNPIYAVEPGVRSISATATSTSAEECFDIAKMWLEDCSFNHMKCSSNEGSGPIPKPTYLLDVTVKGPKGVPGIKLVDGQFLDPFTEYVTLSHCWGMSRDPDRKRIRLHKKTLQALRQGVAASSLPKTFSDAALATARLGYRYLWIDALCIMHDSERSVLDEVANMHRTYGEATLNLSATGATDDSAGLFFNRNVLALQPATVEVAEGFGITSGTYKILRSTIWDDLVDTSPVSQRSWCLAERCLSKRTLHFTRNELLWECQQMCCSEVFPKGLPVTMKNAHEQEKRNNAVGAGPAPMTPGGSEASRPLLPQPRLSFNKRTHHQRTANWHTLVELYTDGRQTYTSDKLLGMAGIARQYLTRNRLKHSDYLVGMWRPAFPHSLLWRVHEGGRRPPKYRAPSWTWASVDGRVVSPAPSHASKQTCLEVIDISVNMKHNDPLGLCEGGCLKVRGFMGKGSLRRTRDYWGHCSFSLYPQLASKGQNIGEVKFENAWFDERLPKLCDDTAGIMVETLEVYLLPVIDVMDRVEGLILCATMKKGEFKRLGLFEISNGGSGVGAMGAQGNVNPEVQGPVQANWDRFKRVMKGNEEMMNFEERLDHTNAYWFASDYTYTINIL